jgi:hypothetical protein
MRWIFHGNIGVKSSVKTTSHARVPLAILKRWDARGALRYLNPIASITSFILPNCTA